MKKTFLLLLMAFIMPWCNLKAQQSHDYILMLDNGASTTDQEYAYMKRGAIKLMEQLLACNNRNRIAVVQYGVGKYGSNPSAYEPLVYIENDFTNDHYRLTIENLTRRLDYGDLFNESLGMVGNALDGTSNAGIISPQTTLNSFQPLKVIVFTDAERNVGGLNGSYLVNYDYPAQNLNETFHNVMNFKIGRGAKFTILHTNTNTLAKEAAACIASSGTSYSGNVEYNFVDPDVNAPSRSYYNRPNGFFIGQPDMDYWQNMASNICDSNDLATFNFRYEQSCLSINQLSNIGGYYNLPSGAVLQGMRAEVISLASGNVYDVSFNPTYGPGNYFSYQLQPSDFNSLINAGETGEFKFKLTMSYQHYGQNFRVFSWNNYPFFDYDITTTCPVFRAASSLTEEKLFKLTPNPTNGLFKVILNKEIKSGKLEIKDLVGNTVYSKVLRGEKEKEIDLSSRKEGVYIVNVTTDKNEIYSEKMIKK